MSEQLPESSPGTSSTTPMEEKATPASAEEKPSPSGNWWDSLLSSAKTKSAEVYSMVKKDLDEIGTAVKCEANHVLNSTSTAIGKTFKFDEEESPANYMKKSFSTFLGQVSTVLNPEPDDEDDTEVILSSGDTTMLSTYNKELEALQRVDATFLVPADSGEFEAWKQTLECGPDGVMTTQAASKRLYVSPLLRAQFDKLVPDAVSRDDFWERYLFRVALLQDRLAAASNRKQEEPTTDPVLANLPLCTAEPITQSPKLAVTPDELAVVNENVPEIVDDALAWVEEDFAHDVELTEEQQILLLEEYEKEISSKKLSTKHTSTRDVANNNTKSQKTNTPKSTSNITQPASNKQAASNEQQPASNKQQPASNKQQPASNKQQPASNKQQPASNKQQQARDRVNNKTTIKKTPQTKTPVDKKKNTRPAKNAPNSDTCGNNIVEDYFGDKEQKDDSDESWEKEFEIDEVKTV